MSDPLSIDPEACFNVVEGWNEPVGEAFNSLSEAASCIRELQLGADGFAGAAVSFANGVRGIKGAVQAVARASTDADLGGMSAFDAVQESLANALAGGLPIGFDGGVEKLPDDPVAQAEEYAKLFPDPKEGGKEPTLEEVQEVAAFLEENRDNEEVMKAFYGAVPAANLLAYVESLQALSVSQGGNDVVMQAQHDVVVVLGQTMADASRKGWLPDGYDSDLVAAVDNASDNEIGYTAPGWALAHLLRNGDYNAEFLTTIGDGVLAIEKELRDRSKSDATTWSNDDKWSLGFGGNGSIDPVTEVIGAMSRSSDASALSAFLYPGGNADDELNQARMDYLIDRQAVVRDTDYGAKMARAFEVLAVPELFGKTGSVIDPETVAADAIKKLPAVLGDTPSTIARQSVATIVTNFWEKIDPLLTKVTEDDFMSSAALDVRRSDVQKILGIVLDLDDFDPNGPQIGTSPSARIITTMMAFNDARNVANLEKYGLEGEVTALGHKDGIHAMGFVLEAGSMDDLDRAGEGDGRVLVMRSFMIDVAGALVSTGATAVGAAAGTATGIPGAGTVGGVVVGAAAGKAAKALLEDWVPTTESLERADQQRRRAGAQLVSLADETLAIRLYEIYGPTENGPKDPAYIDDDGNLVWADELDGQIIDENGNLIISSADDDVARELGDRSTFTLEQLARLGINITDIRTNFETGRGEANDDFEKYTIS